MAVHNILANFDSLAQYYFLQPCTQLHTPIEYLCQLLPTTFFILTECDVLLAKVIQPYILGCRLLYTGQHVHKLPKRDYLEERRH